MDRKKEAKNLYKNMKPKMGLFIVRFKKESKCYLQATRDLRGVMNGTKFKLEVGLHPNQALQKAWKEQGESSFVIEVLEELEYDKDETKDDYSEDLQILKLLWEDKLAKEGMETL